MNDNKNKKFLGWYGKAVIDGEFLNFISEDKLSIKKENGAIFITISSQTNFEGKSEFIGLRIPEKEFEPLFSTFLTETKNNSEAQTC